ncbi:MAG TPA: HD domain-containing phosphohydrolase [Dehalococcoidia bacterium]|nr:HD domain-containing phosphohydrolase [Dehalococcoidia bacterium]
MNEVRGQNALFESVSAERTQGPRRLQQHTVSALLIPVSQAIDLAEGRAPGHANRVAYIASSLGAALELNTELQLATLYAALVHDIGAISAGAELAGFTRGDERLVFASLPLLSPDEAVAGASDTPEAIVDRVAEHVTHGARAARELDLSDEVAKGIATHHERYDGAGYPRGLSGNAVPMVGRIVGLADLVESLIDQTTPLLARRNFSYWLSGFSGKECDPEIVDALRVLGAGDSFWLGLFSNDLVGELASRTSRMREPKAMRLLPFAESFSRLVDARFAFTVGVSARVARYAESLGRVAGLSDVRLKLLQVAALLHDVGQLSMSERVLSKPGILSVEELGALHLHTIYSRDVVAGIQGLEEVSLWVEAHHERIDGRGYPEGRSGEEIPLESRILAIADAYVAITSDRPHRPKVEGKEAMERLRGAAGTQLDAQLVEAFLRQVI